MPRLASRIHRIPSEPSAKRRVLLRAPIGKRLWGVVVSELLVASLVSAAFTAGVCASSAPTVT